MIAISKVIRNILKDNSEVNSLISGEAYNVINDREKGIKFPYLVVRLRNLSADYDKGYKVGDSVLFDVLCVAKGYDAKIELATAVRNCLESKEFEINGHRITRVMFTGYSENYADDSYTGIVSFSTDINEN